jgi:hypothetical protein
MGGGGGRRREEGGGGKGKRGDVEFGGEGIGDAFYRRITE